MIVNTKLPGIFNLSGKRRQLCTRSLAPGHSSFEEFVVKEAGDEYRVWDPSRSKLAASIMLGCRDPGLRPGDVVMYLGASHGYTPSFVSDIAGNDGFVFALDFAPRVVRDLIFVSMQRTNMAPILADAAHPERYAYRVCQVDWLYQDVAQKDQVGIFLKNIKWFLKEGGYACLALKARSVDVSKNPREVFAKVRCALEKEVTVIEAIELDPFQKGHCFFVVKNAPRNIPPQPIAPIRSPTQQGSLPSSANRPAQISQSPASASGRPQPKSPKPAEQRRWLGQQSDPKYAGKPSPQKKPQGKPSKFNLEPL